MKPTLHNAALALGTISLLIFVVGAFWPKNDAGGAEERRANFDERFPLPAKRASTTVYLIGGEQRGSKVIGGKRLYVASLPGGVECYFMRRAPGAWDVTWTWCRDLLAAMASGAHAPAVAALRGAPPQTDVPAHHPRIAHAK